MTDVHDTLDVNQFWKEIGEFDEKELDISKGMESCRWEARESARMEAYNRLFDRLLNKDKYERRFHCDDIRSTIK